MAVFEYWADRFRWDYISQIDAFAGCLSDRVLPAFANIDEEGKQIAEERYQELLSGCGGESDWGSLGELAQDRAITYYETMYGLRQGIVNMFAVGLWHLFEQQLADFVRHAILDYPANLDKNPNFARACSLLHNTKWGIDITRFQSYARVDELHHLANCAKHGDGDACTKLRALRPALFSPFGLETGASLGFGRGPVIAPLGGEHLYLTADDFKDYAEAVKAFWTELSTEVRSIVTRLNASESGA